MDLRPQNYLSLCAGIGGLDLGVKLALPESRPRLNPLFVEMLMGLPPGWTDFGRLEMGLYLSRLRRLFASLCEG